MIPPDAAFSVLDRWKRESTSLQMLAVNASVVSSASGPITSVWPSVKVVEVSPDAPSFTLDCESGGERETLEFRDFKGATFEAWDVKGPTVSNAVRVWQLRQGNLTVVLTEVVG